MAQAPAAFLKRAFNNQQAAVDYITSLRETLYTHGFPAASVDSVAADSAKASVWIYTGPKLHWNVILDSLPPEILASLRLSAKALNRPMDYNRLKAIQAHILNFYENTGYPFARIYSKSVVTEDSMHTTLLVDQRVLYHIDSIRIVGNAKLNDVFLQHYLGIKNGDTYNKNRLAKIGQLIGNLSYVQETQPWDLMMLGTGATINLYLEPRRSSEINALVGFLPSAGSVSGKTKITADVRLNLKNALSNGETIFVNWQQLEAQSPRLDLRFNQPYLFNTPYGIDLSFGMFKKDSSYLQLNAGVGLQYSWSGNQNLSIFYGIKNNFLLQGGLDTNAIRYSKQLPANMDVRSANGGLTYRFDRLDYLLNPRKGFQIAATASAGIRRITRNPDIMGLKDPFQPDFDFASLYDTIQLRTHLITSHIEAANYRSLARNSVVKVALQAGWMISPQIFRNELFRIGGYRTLRGFDEESIYADRYGVLTGEYRLLTGTNSFLFAFADLALTRSPLFSQVNRHSFASTGLGLELETGFGLLNVSYAIGKRDDVKFDIRNASKIHIGYINYF